MRVYVKKKQYRQKVQALVQAGQNNNASGAWSTSDHGNKTSASHSFHGAKGNKAEKDRRPNKGGSVKPHKIQDGNKKKKRDEQE